MSFSEWLKNMYKFNKKPANMFSKIVNYRLDYAQTTYKSVALLLSLNRYVIGNLEKLDFIAEKINPER